MSATPLMEIALRCVRVGWYVFPLGVKSKVTDVNLAPNSHKSASNDPEQITKWWTASPDANIGIDLGRSNLTVLDFDNGLPPAELGLHDKFQVSTSRGTHVYFIGVSKQGNMYFNGQHTGEIKSEGGYVLAPFSQHPDGPVYDITVRNDITPLPDGLMERLRPERKSSPTLEGEKIPRGQHDNELTRIAGKLRQCGAEEEAIYNAIVEVCEKRCENYGNDYMEMCRKIAHSVCRYPAGKDETLHLSGVARTPNHTEESVDWRSRFRSIGELEQGEVRMLIGGFLPEGTTFVGGLAGEGKTLFALSIAKALTTGEPFLGFFDVPEVVPVIYLIPESGGRAFRNRCERFHIPNNPELFLCRTISEGATLPLDDASLFEAVRKMRPVVILDTLIRFSEADDENQAIQNKMLVDDIIRLRQAGASGVIGLHHATKAMREKGMSLESALRGTGDIAACADAVYGLLRDSALYSNGAGPNEIDVACLKPRDFEPPFPFRIAASQRIDSTSMTLGPAPGIVSVIDEHSDFLMVDKAAGEQAVVDTLERLVREDPALTLVELGKMTGRSTWTIRQTLKTRKWFKSRGGTKGASRWTIASGSGFEGGQNTETSGPGVVVNLDAGTST